MPFNDLNIVMFHKNNTIRADDLPQTITVFAHESKLDFVYSK